MFFIHFEHTVLRTKSFGTELSFTWTDVWYCIHSQKNYYLLPIGISSIVKSVCIECSVLKSLILTLNHFVVVYFKIWVFFNNTFMSCCLFLDFLFNLYFLGVVINHYLDLGKFWFSIIYVIKYIFNFSFRLCDDWLLLCSGKNYAR